MFNMQGGYSGEKRYTARDPKTKAMIHNPDSNEDPSFSMNGTDKENELGLEKMCLMSYANNKGADQPAHPRSLISAFVVCCLDSIISLDSIAEISRRQLASVAAQAGLCLAWSETPEDTFSNDEAQM